MHRALAPSGPLHEEHELIWDDGVAAETCLDFDAPHIGKWEGLMWWLGWVYPHLLRVEAPPSWTDTQQTNPNHHHRISEWKLSTTHRGFGFFGAVFGVAAITGPAAQNQAAPRGPTLPFGNLHVELGKDPDTAPAPPADEGGEDHDEDDEEEEDDDDEDDDE